MTRFTPRETATVQGLVEHWRLSILQAMRHDPRITPEGRRQYEADLRTADDILRKLDVDAELAA